MRLSIDIARANWKTWFMLLTLLIAAGGTAYFGAKVAVDIDFNDRVIAALEQHVNSSVSFMELPCSFIIGILGAQYYSLNGTNGKLVDHSTNASAVINNAIGNLTGGGTIMLKGQQTYLNPIVLANNVALIGDRASTTLLFNGGYADYFIGAVGTQTVPLTNVMVRNLRILYNSTGDGGVYGDVIQFSFVNNSLVDSCLINGTGIAEEATVFYNSTYSTISNNHYFACGDTLNSPVQLYDSKYCDVVNNFVDMTGSQVTTGAAIMLTGSSGAVNNPCKYNIVEGNTVYNSPASGIQLANNAHFNTIANNIIVNTTVIGIDLAATNPPTFNKIIGNQVYNTTRHAINIGGGYCDVIGNTVNTTGSAGDGIRVYQKDGTSIVGNTVLNAGEYGISLNKANGSIVNDNTIMFAQQHGIFLNNGCNKTSVVGNTVISCGQKTANTYAGIYVSGFSAVYSSYNTITGNTVSGSSQKYALQVSSTCSSIYVTGNVFQEAATSECSIAAGTCTFGNNIGFVTENSVSATNSTAKTFVFNHGLAAAATYVWCSFNTTTVTGYTWTSTATQIRVTVTGMFVNAVITCYCKCEYVP